MGNLELLTGLMELTLQMNLEHYEKSRAFEGVIMFHCEINQSTISTFKLLYDIVFAF